VLCIGQKHYDFNAVCQQAYHSIVELRLDEGRRILDGERKRDPGNLIPYLLDNYIDFFQLFFNEDATQYSAWKDRRDQRLDLMSQGPAGSPWNLFGRSLIHFQWAAIQIKFGDNWDAAWDFRRSFLQSKDCASQFPSFLPASMLNGAMEVVAGTIPDGYKWLSNLLGIKGSIAGGTQKLEQFLAADDAYASLYHDEAIFYYLYLQFYLSNKRAEVFAFIRQHQLDVRNNHLFTYLYANLCINDQRSALAQQVIRQMNPSPDYLDMPVWDLEMGYARLNHLEPEALEHFQLFLVRFRGKFYVKDVLQKMSWYYYLKGDTFRADSCRRQVLVRGSAASDADRQALKEARSGRWPNKVLLKARLLDDGGYFEEALQVLQGMDPAELRDQVERCEYIYRMGRIYDGLGRADEAIEAYQGAIRLGEHLKEYYAARAALQAGNIYEQRGDRAKAISLYEKCLSMPEHDFKNSLDQRAKAGIARCKGQ
jgi:tetratricopeptide (TPR) repeat protein